MTATKDNNSKGMVSSRDILSALEDLKISESKTAQVKAILCIGIINKITLLPFICKIISEQSVFYYTDCADHFCEVLKLSDEEKMNVHLRPDIKEFIDGIVDTSSEQEICVDIDRRFALEHPREKIAYLYKLAKKGSVYAQLNAGSRMTMLDEDPNFLFNTPFIARRVLRKGIDGLHTLETESVLNIRSSMKSLIIEAHVKYIKASLECGHNVSELIEEITWITTNSPKHHRWLMLISKTKELSQIFQ